MPAPDVDHALVRRATAAEKTLRTWETQPMKLGRADCVRMTAAHLRLLGYSVRLPPEGSYASVRGAMAKLKERGFASVAEALDDLGLKRITPAAAIVGDVILMPAEHELGAIVVCMGNGRVAGWHDDYAAGVVVMQPILMTAAWRADPL